MKRITIDNVTFNIFTYDEYQFTDFPFVRNQKKIEYLNVPIAFDIETTRITIGYDEKLKRSTYFTYMWVWQVAINDDVIIGRTWDEFKTFMRRLHHNYQLNENRRAIFFVHNLAYEFSFMCSQLPICEVFATKPHKPIQVKCGQELTGIDFKCTYSISGYSLAHLTDSYPLGIKKQVGELNYRVIRTSKTRLYKKTLKYICADVITVSRYILYLINNEKTKCVGDIPLTKTGFVRRDARAAYGKDPEYRKLFNKLRLDENTYRMYRAAFRGGDSHANALFCNEIVNIDSFDLTSSYPFQMVSRDFPASAPVYVESPTISQLQMLIKNSRLFIVDITLSDVYLKRGGYTYISRSLCYQSTGERVENGRIYQASALRLIATSIDLFLISQYYDFKISSINKLLYHYSKALLPPSMRGYILNLYRKKTEFKGISDKQTQYMHIKELLNSLYGMCVTDMVRDEIIFDTGTLEYSVKTSTNLKNSVSAFYANKNNFNIYEIGVWVTAYARYDLHTALMGNNNSCIYWDTDSVKTTENIERFERLNELKLKRLSEIYQNNEYSATDIKGKEHIIGLWDRETNAPIPFKALGAKKYCYFDKEFKITVSGINKKTGADYFRKFKKPFNKFSLDTVVPCKYSGRTTSEYVSEPYTTYINGVKCSENSYLNIIDVPYTFGDVSDHLYFIEKLKKGASIFEEYKQNDAR